MSLVPKISAGGIMHALKSPEVLAVGSAVLIAPILTIHLRNWLSKVVPNDYMTIAIVAVSIVILLAATKIKSNIFRAVMIGFAGANFFVAVLPYFSGILNKVTA